MGSRRVAGRIVSSWRAVTSCFHAAGQSCVRRTSTWSGVEAETDHALAVLLRSGGIRPQGLQVADQRANLRFVLVAERATGGLAGAVVAASGSSRNALFGVRLEWVLNEFVDQYDHARLHLGMGVDAPIPFQPTSDTCRPVERVDRLGGLIHEDR